MQEPPASAPLAVTAEAADADCLAAAERACVALHADLWLFQCALWHSAEQYDACMRPWQDQKDQYSYEWKEIDPVCTAPVCDDSDRHIRMYIPAYNKRALMQQMRTLFLSLLR